MFSHLSVANVWREVQIHSCFIKIAFLTLLLVLCLECICNLKNILQFVSTEKVEPLFHLSIKGCFIAAYWLIFQPNCLFNGSPLHLCLSKMTPECIPIIQISMWMSERIITSGKLDRSKLLHDSMLMHWLFYSLHCSCIALNLKPTWVNMFATLFTLNIQPSLERF